MFSESRSNTIDPNSPVILVNRIGDSMNMVRWFTDLWSAERNHALMTVTARGVRVHSVYLNEIPESWLSAAQDAYQALREDVRVDLSHMATHTNSIVSNGPLVPVSK